RVAASRLTFVLARYGALRHLHSFPTRRSSDLASKRPRPRSNSASASPVRRGPSVDDADPARVRSSVTASSVARSWPAYAFTADTDRKSTRLNSSHVKISYAVFCLKKKKEQ